MKLTELEFAAIMAIRQQDTESCMLTPYQFKGSEKKLALKMLKRGLIKVRRGCPNAFTLTSKALKYYLEGL